MTRIVDALPSHPSAFAVAGEQGESWLGPTLVADTLSEHLQTFARRMHRTGYSEFVASFNPYSTFERSWRERRGAAPAVLLPLIDVFLLNRGARRVDLELVLKDSVADLCSLGLLIEVAGERIRTPFLSLTFVLGHWLFSQRNIGNPTLYYGTDSYALASRLSVRRGGASLDLCAGPGIQSLQLASLGSRVTAVEINPIAVTLAQINRALNGQENTIEVLCGDLYAPVAGRTFDLIAANPPLLPYPDELPYPFVGHGGHDGLRVTRRILDGLPAALAPEGICQTLGCCLSDGILPICYDEFSERAKLSRLDLTMTITSQIPLAPGTPFFHSLITTTAQMPGFDEAHATETFAASLIAQKANHICGYFLHVRRGKGIFRLQDLSAEPSGAVWCV